MAIKGLTHISVHIVNVGGEDGKWKVWVKEGEHWEAVAAWAIGYPVSEWDVDLLLGAIKNVLVDAAERYVGYQPYLTPADPKQR